MPKVSWQGNHAPNAAELILAYKFSGSFRIKCHVCKTVQLIMATGRSFTINLVRDRG